MSRFPSLVHVFLEDNGDDTEFLRAAERGVEEIEVGKRCAIYKLVEEGTVQGPKTFVPNVKRRKA